MLLISHSNHALSCFLQLATMLFLVSCNSLKEGCSRALSQQTQKRKSLSAFGPAIGNALLEELRQIHELMNPFIKMNVEEHFDAGIVSQLMRFHVSQSLPEVVT